MQAPSEGGCQPSLLLRRLDPPAAAFVAGVGLCRGRAVVGGLGCVGVRRGFVCGSAAGAACAGCVKFEAVIKSAVSAVSQGGCNSSRLDQGSQFLWLLVAPKSFNFFEMLEDQLSDQVGASAASPVTKMQGSPRTTAWHADGGRGLPCILVIGKAALQPT